MPCSKSLVEGEAKVLCSPQEQWLGLGLPGPNGLISAGWLEKEPLECAVVGSGPDTWL